VRWLGAAGRSCRWSHGRVKANHIQMVSPGWCPSFTDEVRRAGGSSGDGAGPRNDVFGRGDLSETRWPPPRPPASVPRPSGWPGELRRGAGSGQPCRVQRVVNGIWSCKFTRIRLPGWSRRAAADLLPPSLTGSLLAGCQRGVSRSLSSVLLVSTWWVWPVPSVVFPSPACVLS